MGLKVFFGIRFETAVVAVLRCESHTTHNNKHHNSSALRPGKLRVHVAKDSNENSRAFINQYQPYATSASGVLDCMKLVQYDIMDSST